SDLFLENTGGACGIAETILRSVGKKNVAAARGSMGYVISIPVFADSGFLLLSPLNRSLCKKAGITLSGSAIALGLGLTVSHTMNQPTPGPIATAGILGANLVQVLLASLPVTPLALTVSILFAMFYVSRIYIDPATVIGEEPPQQRNDTAPSVAKSVLPIFVPIVLIVAKSLVKLAGWEDNSFAKDAIMFLGEPFVALLVAVFLALLLPKQLECSMSSMAGWIGIAFTGAASFILIARAGGIFGIVLEYAGIA